MLIFDEEAQERGLLPAAVECGEAAQELGIGDEVIPALADEGGAGGGRTAAAGGGGSHRRPARAPAKTGGSGGGGASNPRPSRSNWPPALSAR